MNENQPVVKNRLRVLEHAKKIGNIRKTCRYFGIPRSSFYRWLVGQPSTQNWSGTGYARTGFMVSHGNPRG